MSLNGTVAIVTGGNSGIGKGIVLALAEAGANIVIDYVSDPDATEQLEKQVAALGSSTSRRCTRTGRSPTQHPVRLSKGGMRMLTRTAGVELAPHGVLVVGVGPGAVDTPIGMALFNLANLAGSASVEAQLSPGL